MLASSVRISGREQGRSSTVGRSRRMAVTSCCFLARDNPTRFPETPRDVRMTAEGALRPIVAFNDRCRHVPVGNHAQVVRTASVRAHLACEHSRAPEERPAYDDIRFDRCRVKWVIRCRSSDHAHQRGNKGASVDYCRVGPNRRARTRRSACVNSARPRYNPARSRQLIDHDGSSPPWRCLPKGTLSVDR